MVRSQAVLPLRAPAPIQVDSSSEVAKHMLPEHYVPSKYCVLCGRGRGCFNAIGNRRFRVLVNIYLEKYKEAPNRLVKGQIVSEIVDTVRGSGGQFAKIDDDGRWWEIGDCAARYVTHCKAPRFDIECAYRVIYACAPQGEGWICLS
jgi:hypothetical protein